MTLGSKAHATRRPTGFAWASPKAAASTTATNNERNRSNRCMSTHWSKTSAKFSALTRSEAYGLYSSGFKPTYRILLAYHQTIQNQQAKINDLEKKLVL